MDFNWTSLEPAFDCNSPHSAAFTVAFDMCRATYYSDFILVLEAEHLIVGDVESRLQVEWGTALGNRFIDWREQVPPCLPAFLALACEYFDIPQDHKLLTAALMATVLAETQHLNAYHNTHHFREVFVMVMRLCATHNQLNDENYDRLTADDILLLLIAAAIHDFAHDGGGNFNYGVHNPSRLEKKSLAESKPFLQIAGLDDDVLNIIDVLVMSTDVTNDGTTDSPSLLTRKAFEAHYHPSKSGMPDLPKHIQLISRDKKIALMAAILGEADITPSAGLSYDLSKYLTVLVAEESGYLQPSAATLHGFMGRICHGCYVTPAARALMAENFTGINLQAEEDSEKDVLYA